MLKYSKQRNLVYQAVKSRPVHPTASAVYSMIRKEHPRISLGTVYRNLNQLTEQGLLIKLHMPESGDRFDANVKPHAHLVCTQCGEVDDCTLDFVERLRESVMQSRGFELDERNLVFKGICQGCAVKAQELPAAVDESE